MNVADRCRSSGWGVGTLLASVDENGARQVIEITAVGDTKILARSVLLDDEPAEGVEAVWSLSFRDWREAT